MIIADLQIHSRYARACSPAISIDNLEKYARIKGLHLLGTGDFQHPLWRKEIDEKLKEDTHGILRTSSGFPFIWQTEVSLMYSQDGQRRAIHHLIFSPNTNVSNEITKYLGSKGRLDYDGRPIFGITSPQLVEDLKRISDDIEIIPAHCMTPWFGLFGSKSGFSSLAECFQDQRKHIYAIESGMSADPSMLWRLNENISIVSFSDLHSFWPWRIGREATIFDINIDALSYKSIIKQIRENSFLATIETEPAYGKYHYDGHRACNFSCSPVKTKELGGICPVCGKELTIGVDYRVEQLAKMPAGFFPAKRKKFYKVLPLHELIAFQLKSTLNSKKTWQTYNQLIEKFGNEFNVLIEVDKSDIINAGFNQELAELIINNRIGNLKVKPGYDGVYGEIQTSVLQKRLF